ncbi:DNA helicase-2 / ATP-dependent DNA helicase PcrA [Methylobacterium sp. ap11]|nr:DNA helicase-2 / ATP-dependent DNA helicase PcrA [Methylobacterium sp. ap11]
MKLASLFPRRSECKDDILRLSNPTNDYPAIRAAAVRLLKNGHISDIISSTYSRIIVDEYQDCSIFQHAIVWFASQSLPTCVLGDPLQAIFGFGKDQLADWNKHVCIHFPIVGELNTPWRWVNAGQAAFGNWLLDVRRKLIEGEAIDLRTSPSNVTWINLDGTSDHAKKLAAARTIVKGEDSRVIIIADSKSPASQRRFASQTPGAVTIEAVDLKDLINFSNNLDLENNHCVEQIASFAQMVMTSINPADLISRINSIKQGRNKTEPSDVEKAAIKLYDTRSHQSVIDLLVEMNKEAGVTVYRPAVLRSCIGALRLTIGPNAVDFKEAAIKIREQNRLVGRPLPKRSVGSTLLLKGLEADGAVILDADDLDRKNLYVAMTRGSTSLVICSTRNVLDPPRI